MFFYFGLDPLTHHRRSDARNPDRLSVGRSLRRQRETLALARRGSGLAMHAAGVPEPFRLRHSFRVNGKLELYLIIAALAPF